MAARSRLSRTISASQAAARWTWDAGSLLKGFRTSASAPSLAPFSPGTDGRATFDAAVEGNLSRWTVDGRLRIDDLRAAGWRARLVEGPVEASLGGGGTTVRSSLQAVGGGGERWWSELIGARPQGSLTATRHPDGRWVIDRAEAKGAALALSARGVRGLTGAASFRARIEALDLGRIRRSAGGEMRIDVSGSSPAADKPWTWRMGGAGRARLRVIAISARDDAETGILARQLGAQFFFRKPVDDQALIDAIHWVTGSDCPKPSSAPISSP